MAQPLLLNPEAARQRLARDLYKAHTLASHGADGLGLSDVDFDEWYRTNADMPLSGPGFVRLWEACADVAIAAVEYLSASPGFEAEETDLVKALVVLARKGVPTDVQELLVGGNPSRGIPPGALQAVLDRR